MSDPAGTRPRVVLVGPMGSGKTTVGRLLAQRWDVSVRDTDEDIEHAEGRAISEIFVDDGEERFRDLERAAVAAALASHEGVLSLGGGAVLAEETRERLSGHTVVFLRVGLSEAVKRVGLGTSRPLLLGNVRSRVKALLDERTPVYEQVATFSVDTDGRAPEAVAEEIARGLDTPSPGGSGYSTNGEPSPSGSGYSTTRDQEPPSGSGYSTSGDGER